MGSFILGEMVTTGVMPPSYKTEDRILPLSIVNLVVQTHLGVLNSVQAYLGGTVGLVPDCHRNKASVTIK